MLIVTRSYDGSKHFSELSQPIEDHYSQLDNREQYIIFSKLEDNL